ncbi:MAG: hypothetical protein IPL19_08415 [Sandaracinaceae bacterium]|jgi:hypothetical protein|nr:hypothetical protein [Sandaracinaceae bacterium]
MPSPRRVLVPSLALSLAALSGCYDAHDLTLGPPPLEDGSVGELGLPDAAVDSGLDAGQPACQQDFVVRTLSLPDDVSGVGFDLDGGGAEVGCGMDGPGGVDNAFGRLAGLVQLVGVDIDQLLTAAITLRLVRLRVRLDRCGDTPTLVMVDDDGAAIGSPRAAVVETGTDGSITFEGSVELVPIVLMVPFGPGIQIDISLDNVQLAGTFADTNLSRLVLGGELPRERIVALAEAFAGPAGMNPETIEALLVTLLDLHVDENTGSCTAMSGAFLATGRVLRP